MRFEKTSPKLWHQKIDHVYMQKPNDVHQPFWIAIHVITLTDKKLITNSIHKMTRAYPTL
jgi:hypothetical protein